MTGQGMLVRLQHLVGLSRSQFLGFILYLIKFLQGLGLLTNDNTAPVWDLMALTERHDRDQYVTASCQSQAKARRVKSALQQGSYPV